jgi:hypothetical protein
MDEVEAVARAIQARLESGWDDLDEAEQGEALGMARSAIAALDAYRTSPQRAIDYIERSPHIQEAIRKAKSEPPIEWGDDGVSDFAQGREVGLREAAARVERMRPAATPTWIMPRMAREILALIDAGSQTPPTKD